MRKLDHSISSPEHVEGRGARRLATPRSRDDEEAAVKALETKIAREGLILTEAQVIALEKAKTGKEAQRPSSRANAPAIAARRTASAPAT